MPPLPKFPFVDVQIISPLHPCWSFTRSLSANLIVAADEGLDNLRFLGTLRSIEGALVITGSHMVNLDGLNNLQVCVAGCMYTRESRDPTKLVHIPWCVRSDCQGWHGPLEAGRPRVRVCPCIPTICGQLGRLLQPATSQYLGWIWGIQSARRPHDRELQQPSGPSRSGGVRRLLPQSLLACCCMTSELHVHSGTASGTFSP